MKNNIDNKTVESFGDEWKKFDQSNLQIEEADEIFQNYFSVFPWEMINHSSEGFDLGCGTASPLPPTCPSPLASVQLLVKPPVIPGKTQLGLVEFE